MGTRADKALAQLRSGLTEYLDLEPTERHIFLHSMITRGMSVLDAGRPILVGGGAVEFYTGVRFITGDLDLVAPDIGACRRVLEAFGFIKLENEKYFVSRAIASLVEIHGARLAGDEKTVEVIYRKVPILLVSPEDCIAERLASFRRHGSSLDLLNAFLIAYHQRDRLDYVHLQKRIGALDLWEHYSVIQDIARSLVCHQSGVDEAAGALIHLMKKEIPQCAF